MLAISGQGKTALEQLIIRPAHVWLKPTEPEGPNTKSYISGDIDSSILGHCNPPALLYPSPASPALRR
jgi:hypothetical protein